MRAVVYPRVSGVIQRERDTIASQLRELPAFVARMGWDLVRPADTYIDDGFSASRELAARRGWAALIRDAALGLFDVVVVMNVDRLTRAEDFIERYTVIGALQRANVRIADVMKGQVLDLKTSHGDLMVTLDAYFAAEESRKRVERTVAGKITAAHKGRNPHGVTPYGLRFDRDSGAWSVDPVRGPIVLEIHTRVAAGETCYALALELQERGPELAPPPRRAWHRSFVCAIVNADYYCGQWVVDKKRRIAIAVPPIVTAEVRDRALEQLDASRRRGLRRTKHVYLLEALAQCECGGRIMIHAKTSTSPRYYKCRHRSSRRPLDVPQCFEPRNETSELDDRVWEAVVRELEDPDLPAALAAERMANAENQHEWDADIAGYRERLGRLDRKAADALTLWRRDVITSADLDREMAAINGERKVITAQLQVAERAAASITNAQGRLRDAESIVQRLRAKLHNAPLELRREIVQTLVTEAVVVGNKVYLEMLVPRFADAAAGGGSRRRSSSEVRTPEHLRIRLVA